MYGTPHTLGVFPGKNGEVGLSPRFHAVVFLVIHASGFLFMEINDHNPIPPFRNSTAPQKKKNMGIPDAGGNLGPTPRLKMAMVSTSFTKHGNAGTFIYSGASKPPLKNVRMGRGMIIETQY